MGEGEVKRERFCSALDRTITVIEVYGFQGSGACPVSSALVELLCDGERECRQTGRYQDCTLWDDYEGIFGVNSS